MFYSVPSYAIIAFVTVNKCSRNLPDQSLVSCHKHTTYGQRRRHFVSDSIHTPNATLMITLSVDICNPVSQDFYNKTIYNLPFHRLVCTCGHSGCLTIHGYYDRSIKSGDSCLKLHICRVICSECGRTHALLLSSMVPYSQISTTQQIDIICHSESDGDFSELMDNTPSIDENCVHSVIRRFRQHWKQRLLSEAITIMPDTDFIKCCFSSFRRQFMQIKSTPNILFLTPT